MLQLETINRHESVVISRRDEISKIQLCTTAAILCPNKRVNMAVHLAELYFVSGSYDVWLLSGCVGLAI